MALLLNIDTATEAASVGISLNGDSIAFRENQHQKEHASFVHAAISDMLEEVGYSLQDIEAFAVTSGPGSYTGLRVGIAAAKGFCYAFSKPLIMVNTLEVMAKAALDSGNTFSGTDLLCPMIDARRMEVFAALFDIGLNCVLPPQPVILDGESFNKLMIERKLVFFGSGSLKFGPMVSSRNSQFANISHSAKDLGTLAEQAFQKKNFSDVSYSEPSYFKDFHSTSKTHT
ncbi:tRNA (adenosine(37)-N6)-threonylcarbamoyltransferase complex dimerization subunit type 1 TsaB [Segetibacter aerophilus]|uniref:tRNA (Adenosine(37)-N6)-threonylcarbamoyltransferase complex dimerization subunit type 1 TsaB n=1 Tax=Segetibacter aerophilus TaxID=670293 RepID=A0A512BG04_9BACT|nr:tRNA (adenosine(37)-N6)-threonylcarbamoyltransferase complex dimerization subunit type 1 TsaB [Segetibacter aerophilus]GEO10891.1 tRNA (adenosine(37)-N6)-threonylcarbamoyltransferase complex dimerization subunit type 1 TsaB [Segetibacter aerophilus]